MANKPTLYKIGTIVPQKWMSEKEKGLAATQPAIEYIVSYILDRIPTKRSAPRVSPKSPGDMVLLLKSGTGSGKSTTVAPAIFQKQECAIAVTQPRILTTVEITHDILKYNPSLQLGANIGYQTGVMRHKAIKKKGINFMTVGVLLQQFITRGIDAIATAYSIIIIDEVHEKSLETETIMYYLKLMITDHWNNVCPLIILTSATFDEKKFQSYFQIPAYNYIEVSGFSYPIRDVWPKYPIRNYMSETLRLVKHLHMNGTDDFTKQQRDIIIFVKGATDINYLLDELTKLNEDAQMVKKAGLIYPLGLNREIFVESGKRYTDIMVPIDTVKVGKTKPTRRVIIATNVAETGVTIETLKYCIDTGFFINVWNDGVFNTEVISAAPVTKFMATQRRGRVGRKAPGEWYPLYTKDLFDLLENDQPAKFVTTDISSAILNMIITQTHTVFTEAISPGEPSELFDIFTDSSQYMSRHHHIQEKTAGLYRVQSESKWNPYSLDLLESPSVDSLYLALDKLNILGFIDNNFQPTMMGCMANQLRKISPESIRMIFAGYSYGANVLDLITIASFIEVGEIGIFSAPKYKRQPFIPSCLEQYGKLAFKILWACEFIEYIWIWNSFMKKINTLLKSKRATIVNELGKWCDDHSLRLSGLYDVVARRDELIANFIVLDLNPFYNGLTLERGTYNLEDIVCKDMNLGIAEIQKIKRSIVDGFRMNICRWDPHSQKYLNMYKHIPVSVDSQLVRPPIVNDVPAGQPYMIIVSDIVLRQKHGSDMYEYVISGPISILDGFVQLDENMLFTI
jgi:HrpA-like RNA helicase